MGHVPAWTGRSGAHCAPFPAVGARITRPHPPILQKHAAFKTDAIKLFQTGFQDLAMPLPERKKLRLVDYDYSQAGLYFVTICISNRRNLLWNDTNPSASTQLVIVSLSKIGQIVDSAIQNIPVYYPNVSVEKYVIMPNHIHLILQIFGYGGRALRAPTISQIVLQMKAYITKHLGESIWQKGFYDRIIRNDEEYCLIWEYIDSNPINWQDDTQYGSI